MFIKSLKVEEGFFNNLNLEFSQGLNVLVGGRGVGKTSVIELLRFGLGAENLDGTVPSESFSHALSILQSSGRVSIEIVQDGQVITVSRSANDRKPLSSGAFTAPIIFSQKEIETISLNREGRLGLINSFTLNVTESINQLKVDSNILRGLCTQHMSLKKEHNELVDKTLTLSSLKQRESLLLEQHEKIQKENSKIQSSRSIIDKIQNQLASYSVDIQNIKLMKNEFKSKVDILSSPFKRTQILQLTSEFGVNFSSTISNRFSIEQDLIGQLIVNNENAIREIDIALINMNKQKANLENDARKSRTEVDSYIEGAGSVLSELGRLKEQIAQLNNFNNFAIQKQSQINEIYDRVQSKLTEIYQIKEALYQSRLQVIQSLNQSLLPTIRISISQHTNLDSYATALESCLRGSGLKYKELIKTIVERMHPQWLFYYASTLNYGDFSSTIGIPIDRATRLLGYLSEVDLGDVLSANIADTVDLALLDHGQYKSIEELSIGQRCTVALSIILENTSRVLVVDQPEDHLDNEFIAQTLIKSIQQRSSQVQTIVSSHNANIPVLGNANQVIRLESNGRKGYVKVLGSIDNQLIKNSIESIMEGGKEAFQYRANFYKSLQ